MREDKLIEWIEDWFKLAVPNPTTENASVQIGCHFEELSEMTEAIMRGSNLSKHLAQRGGDFKSKLPSNVKAVELVLESPSRSVELRDALCDQIVTAIGIYRMMGWDIQSDLRAVAESNWSKFERGKPVFDENGKINKGKDYFPPKFKEPSQGDFDDLSNLDLFDGVTVEGGVCTDNDEGCEGGACKI